MSGGAKEADGNDQTPRRPDEQIAIGILERDQAGAGFSLRATAGRLPARPLPSLSLEVPGVQRLHEAREGTADVESGPEGYCHGRRESAVLDGRRKKTRPANV